MQGQYVANRRTGKCNFQSQHCTFDRKCPRQTPALEIVLAATDMSTGSHSQADAATFD